MNHSDLPNAGPHERLKDLEREMPTCWALEVLENNERQLGIVTTNDLPASDDLVPIRDRTGYQWRSAAPWGKHLLAQEQEGDDHCADRHDGH
jgi:hypothetical protein